VIAGEKREKRSPKARELRGRFGKGVAPNEVARKERERRWLGVKGGYRTNGPTSPRTLRKARVNTKRAEFLGYHQGGKKIGKDSSNCSSKGQRMELQMSPKKKRGGKG